MKELVNSLREKEKDLKQRLKKEEELKDEYKRAIKDIKKEY